MTYVCLCAAVSETEIIEYIRDGYGTLEQIGQVCDAGTGCGTCIPDIEDLLEEYSEGSNEV